MSSGHDFIVGWDIGGAHLKAALLDSNGCCVNSVQLACPLWRGLHELTATMQKILQLFNLQTSHTQHAVTMTGELVDLFADRDTGVCQIAECASKLLGQNAFYYAANAEFVGANFVALIDVERYANDVASANWHASATLIALHIKNGLLIDIGSTTTDIVPILAGKVAIDATTDAARLQNDTLVYTGIARTPVMALAQKLPFQGTMTNVMAEYFATMADVYRLTCELDPSADMAETADGKSKTPLDSARRLARMVGHDVDSSLEPLDLEPWVQLAFTCRSLQMRQIKTAINKHIQPNMRMITMGVGGFLAQAVAAEMHLPSITIGDIFSDIKSDNKAAVEMCFPAYAVAKLMHQSIIKNSI